MKLLLSTLLSGVITKFCYSSGVPLQTVNTEEPTEEPTMMPTVDCSSIPQPLINWAFDDLTAEVSDPGIEVEFELEIIDSTGAQLDGEGRLLCNGVNAQVRTIENIPFAVTSPQTFVIFGNTLDVNSRGGGIMAVDSNYNQVGGYAHHEFDSLVYNELDSQFWLAGSDFFRRTTARPGFQYTETGATYDPVTDEYTGIVSLILVYDQFGNSRFFRDCQEISPENTVSTDNVYRGITIDANAGKFLFCERHTNAGGSDFNGVIENAAYYDYALSDAEIQSVCQCNPQ